MCFVNTVRACVRVCARACVLTLLDSSRIASTHCLDSEDTTRMHSVRPHRNLRVCAGSYVALTSPNMLPRERPSWCENETHGVLREQCTSGKESEAGANACNACASAPVVGKLDGHLSIRIRRHLELLRLRFVPTHTNNARPHA